MTSALRQKTELGLFWDVLAATDPKATNQKAWFRSQTSRIRMAK
jgi:hypothetical protein